MIISCFVIYATYRVSYERSPVSEVLRPSDLFIFGISAVCQMGTHREPKYLSGKISTVLLHVTSTMLRSILRVLILFQIFFVIALIFVYTSYTANIVSLLQSTTKSIKTLDDLYNSDLGFGVEDAPYNRNYFEFSRPGTIHRYFFCQSHVSTLCVIQ